MQENSSPSQETDTFMILISATGDFRNLIQFVTPVNIPNTIPRKQQLKTIMFLTPIYQIHTRKYCP